MKSGMNKRWTDESLSLGWTGIPTTLFFLQSDKKISSTAFNVLLNLILHWWDVNEWPHPSMESLAARIGVTTRTIQRALNELEKAQLIDKKPTLKSNPKYKGRNIYDLTKLVEYLTIKGPSISQQIRKKSF
jgi:DNA-binding transcriptional regulator YhcF (GntR family)